MANGETGSNGPQDKQRFFCHSCGGVTVTLTPKEAAEELAHGHDLEAFPLGGRPQAQPIQAVQA